MTGCCRAAPCEEIFNTRQARRNLDSYRKKGLGAIERRMVASISAADLADARVLEIGGGIGAIQSELVAAGAREGEIVELVSAYEPYARELAREKGVEVRSRFRVVDVLEQPNAVAPATIVVMNRVVCCSPDGVRLAEHAAGLAERLLIFSFPRDRFLVRSGAAILNRALRLFRRSFRVFLHARSALVTAGQSHGLQLVASGHNALWEFVTFRRAS